MQYKPPGLIKKIYFQKLTFGDDPFRRGAPRAPCDARLAPCNGARPAPCGGRAARVPVPPSVPRGPAACSRRTPCRHAGKPRTGPPGSHWPVRPCVRRVEGIRVDREAQDEVCIEVRPRRQPLHRCASPPMAPAARAICAPAPSSLLQPVHILLPAPYCVNIMRPPIALPLAPTCTTLPVTAPGGLPLGRRRQHLPGHRAAGRRQRHAHGAQGVQPGRQVLLALRLPCSCRALRPSWLGWGAARRLGFATRRGTGAHACQAAVLCMAEVCKHPPILCRPAGPPARSGTLRVILKPLLPELPGFGAAVVSLRKPPIVRFNLNFGKSLGGGYSAGAIKVQAWGGVERARRERAETWQRPSWD